MTALPAARCRAVSRAEGTSDRSGALRVDSADCAPPDMARFAALNPFTFRSDWRIPVPGTQTHAHSMESVWQGLKIVDGRTDEPMFERPPTKRPPDAERGPDHDYAASTFRYGRAVVDIVTARLLIYLPAYLHVLDRLVPDTVVGEIRGALDEGREVLFYDWDANMDILDPTSSFSHSAIASAWFGGRLAHEFLGIHAGTGGDVARLPLGRYAGPGLPGGGDAGAPAH